MGPARLHILRVSWVSLAGCSAGEQEVAFAGVAGKGGGAFKLAAGFGVAAKFVEEVGAGAGEQMVAQKRGFGNQASTSARPACGPWAMETATARLSSMTGEGMS